MQGIKRNTTGQRRECASSRGWAVAFTGVFVGLRAGDTLRERGTWWQREGEDEACENRRERVGGSWNAGCWWRHRHWDQAEVLGQLSNQSCERRRLTTLAVMAIGWVRQGLVLPLGSPTPTAPSQCHHTPMRVLSLFLILHPHMAHLTLVPNLSLSSFLLIPPPLLQDPNFQEGGREREICSCVRTD